MDDVEIEKDKVYPVAETDAPVLMSLSTWRHDLWLRWSSYCAFRRIPSSPYVLQIGLHDESYLRRNPQASGTDTDEERVAALHASGYLRVKHAVFSEENCLIPFPDEEFETVFVVDMLEFYNRKELEVIFEELSRVMKKGATLLIYAANKRGYDLGVERGLAYKSYLDESFVHNLTTSLFWYTNNYSTPLPRDLSRLTSCCREVFELVKL